MRLQRLAPPFRNAMTLLVGPRDQPQMKICALSEVLEVSAETKGQNRVGHFSKARRMKIMQK